VQIGVGLPGYLGTAVDATLVLDWARRADEAGFAAIAAHDRPDHDTWDPLVTLAAAAPITRRARLITTVLLLPPRDAGLVAKQAATVDVLSGGRLELGVGLGNREQDYTALGAGFSGRGRRFERQLEQINAAWKLAIEAGDASGVLGPPPLQRPRPPIRVGGYQPDAIARALTLADGYIFGNAGLAAMQAKTPEIRQAYRDAGRAGLPIGGLAYVAITNDRDRLRRGEQMLTHYYGKLYKPFEEMTLVGDAAALRDRLAAFAEAGIDNLYLFPVLPELDQLEALATLL
jgi:alkanesulfonate monooxygenase SsuD/methylene tetrahydromethanopterin reductase-like flavin-dependent oxidoreductase (luciferase family)